MSDLELTLSKVFRMLNLAILSVLLLAFVVVFLFADTIEIIDDKRSLLVTPAPGSFAKPTFVGLLHKLQLLTFVYPSSEYLIE